LQRGELDKITCRPRARFNGILRTWGDGIVRTLSDGLKDAVQNALVKVVLARAPGVDGV